MTMQEGHSRVSTHLTPVEQVYKAELAALNRIAESGIYKEYTHETTPEGSRIWTLKRKRSLTEQNLRRLNQHHRNKVPKLSPIGIDFLSPTGNTEWKDIRLSYLLEKPHWAEEGGVLMHKAYLRACAGVIPPRYSPWDFVSNGMPAQFYESEEEKQWWETHNDPYYSKLGCAHGEVRKGFTQEWCYDVKLKVWYRQVKILEEWKFSPEDWKERWVIRSERKRLERNAGEISPRDTKTPEAEAVEDTDQIDVLRKGAAGELGQSGAQQHMMQPVLDDTGLSFVRWAPQSKTVDSPDTRKASLLPQPIVDEAGLSFVGWQQKEKKKRSPSPQRPVNHLGFHSTKKPRGKKRKLSNYVRHSQVDKKSRARRRSLEKPAPRRQQKISLHDVIVDETGLSVVGWTRSNAVKRKA
ncbi:hypothetical protein CB0940_07350 [Cercospora beticola]|uniref:Uncharacterized protein n=1 Tax=Cercospora beticola TaxID=122368 RepID=A0A2G5H7U6_CERBT|nr:hypothetical protein CB0940_07350 [Cercospora beticola]PIA88611.1 hypothetical protein CB0940_07350 [Cercospora beticola]WPB03291.1 hypothetical protein RHO25_007928 [Cercospora beticola]CAK1357988.1 unnamed protein product [Cercospora beticola]